MAKRRAEHRAAAGFTVKSGWASAVLLTGPTSSPRVADSRPVELSNPAVPDARQPYHAGFGTAREQGKELTRLVGSVKKFGGQSVTGVLREYRALAPNVSGAGLVVGSLIDPQTIRNDHIRIHALEGQLFRGVLEDALVRSQLSCSIWRERDLFEVGGTRLKLSEPKLRAALSELGRGVAGGWRAEQKKAALAAWLILAGP